jgi:hypothetical protein
MSEFKFDIDDIVVVIGNNGDAELGEHYFSEGTVGTIKKRYVGEKSLYYKVVDVKDGEYWFVLESDLKLYKPKQKTSVTQEDIDKLIENAEINVRTIHDKVTLVIVKLENGFVLTESSGCVDEANYSAAIGSQECLRKIKDKLWELEGYRLQQNLYEVSENDI